MLNLKIITTILSFCCTNCFHCLKLSYLARNAIIFLLMNLITILFVTLTYDFTPIY